MQTNDDASAQGHSVPGNPPSGDWLIAKPKLRPELNIRVRRDNDRFVATIEDPTRSKFYQVGYAEYRFVSMLDGMSRVQDICKSLQEESEQACFDESSAQAIISWLINNNLLVGNGVATAQRLGQTAQLRRQQEWMGWLNPICFKFNLVNPNRAIGWIAPYCSWLLTRWALIAWCGVSLWAMSELLGQQERFSNSAVGILAPGKWLWLLMVWCLLKVIHETAHGVACKKFGGEVHRAGVLFLLFAPLAFVDVTTSWRSSSRRNRIIVAGAGMYAEMFIAAVAAIVWANLPPGLLADLAYNVVIMAGISTVLFNANPLIRFDGYYILADLLDIVNLYSKGQQWFSDRLRHLVLGFAKSDAICPRHELKWVAAYGSGAFLWRVLLCASLLIVASTLFSGAGLIMAFLGGIFWVVVPLMKQVKQIRVQATSQPVDWLRFSICACVIAAVGLSVVLIKAPSVTRAPALVRFEEEYILRAAADGFVHEIFVRNGQTVQPGQALVKLVNPKLELELHDLRLEAERARIQSRIHHRRNELSLYQSEMRRLETADEQIREKQQQLDFLTVRAPVAGVVYRRGLENLQQSFISQGDPILRVADPGSLDIVASIDQNHVNAFRNQGDSPIRLAFAGMPIFSTSLESIEPRASDELVDPSLGANVGGSLPVRPVTDSAGGVNTQQAEFRLINPRFSAKLHLAGYVEKRLRPGQRGTAFVQGRDQTIGTYLFQSCRQWVREKLETATGNRS